MNVSTFRTISKCMLAIVSLCLVCLVCLVTAGQAAWCAESSAEVNPKETAATEQFRQKWALVVGVSKFTSGIEPLKYASRRISPRIWSSQLIFQPTT